MTSWLLRLLNLPTENLDQVTLGFQSPRWLIAGLVLLVPAAVFIYLRQRRNLPSVPFGLRLTLTTTRVLILALLVWVLGGPVLRLVYSDAQKPVVALVFDHSQSMLQLPAGPFESENDLARFAAAAGYRSSSSTTDPETRRALNRIGRAKLAHSVLDTSAQPLLQELSKKYELQYYSFARDLKRIGVSGGAGKLPEPPTPGGPGGSVNPASYATHLGDALADVLVEGSKRAVPRFLEQADQQARERLKVQGSKGPRVGGIIVFTDGRSTGGRAPADAVQDLAKAGTPLFTVPVGSSQRPRDLAIVDLFATGLVTVGDTARVAVTIESSDFAGRLIKVELKDGNELLDRKELKLSDVEQQQIELTFKATKPGARYLTVHVPPQPEEPEYLRGNNTDTAFVRVSEERTKVLLIEGLPRWDFRFLRNAMRRDNGLAGRTGKEIDLVIESEWRRKSKEEKSRALPRTLDQLAEYHTVIIGDVSPRLLDAAFVELLSKAVRERGLGLIVAAGPLHMPHRYDANLLDLLPVRLQAGVPGRYPRGVPSFRIELAAEGSVHEAMRFYDDPGRNSVAWANLPRYYWSAATERPAPGATVLAYNPIATSYGKAPLIAHHYTGRGRVMFVGTDSTWLWRQSVGDRFFYRFWGQATRFTARRDAKEGKKSWIEVRPVRAQPGEQAEIELMAFGDNGAPRTEPEQTVRITGPGSSEIVLRADPAVKGRYTGKFTPSAAGEYRVSYTEAVEARLRVSVSPEELRQPTVNRDALAQLAVATEGQMVELPDLASLKDKFKGEPTAYSFPDEQTLWDGWRTLMLLIVLYTLDVGLRRLMGLS